MRTILLTAAAILISGCASTDTGYAGNRPTAKDNSTITGTRLPPRNTDGVKGISKEDFGDDRKRLPEGIKAPGT